MDGLTNHTLEDTGEDEMDWSAESEECSSQHSLANSIQKSFVFSKFDTVPREYLPEDIRDKIVTYVAIDEELKKGQREMPRCSDAQRERLAAWIYTEASKVFVITLLCDLGPRVLLQAMGCFKSRNFNDRSLPIEKPGDRNPLAAFPETIWTGLRLSRFYKDQWICLAPIFTSSTYSYDLPSLCILPFVKTGVASNKGAFSVVHKVEIHEHHQRHPQLGKVAIKEISIEHCGNHRETDKLWEIEARALEAINRLNHPHIVNCLAAIRRGEGRYFMFPWADGRSLRDLWESSPEPSPSSEQIHNVILQLRGLADALHRLHNFDDNSTTGQFPSSALAVQAVSPGVPSVYLPDEEDGDRVFTGAGGSIRHGDLKPENILIFCNDSNQFDTLKIADLGLAKQHVVATQERQNVTSMRFGTMRYEAPETVTALQGRSRLYDIWSMGCITLEFIIWILYGNQNLEKFYEQLKGSNPQMCQYFHTFTDPPRAEVRQVVIQWMDHIERFDPEGRRDSAIRDLLNIVRTRLLVVELNPRRQTVLNGKSVEPSTADPRSERYRATALEFRDGLDEILKKAQNPTYLFEIKRRGRIATPNTKSADHLSPTAALRPDGPLGPPRHFPNRPTENGNTERTIRENYALPHLKGWENPIDNDFAEKVFARIGSGILSPAGTENAKLCNQCRGLQFWTGGFAFEVETAKLQRQASNCDFCRLLYASYTRDGLAVTGKIRFERNQSTIVMANHDSHPIFSIFRSPGLKTPLPIQLGLPKLPQVKSDTFFEIIRSWLHDCNANHPDCEGVERESLPTRLIDVGNEQHPILRLVELRKEPIVSEEYVALSHPWGDTNTYTPFCTLREDSGGHSLEDFKKTIPYHQLPATFRDAVDCTRQLGIRYLWIDSICIVQGRGGDFAEEAKKMENVFSGAYCVIAASRAANPHDGFLKTRSQQPFVKFQRDQEEPFYVCKSIDNFGGDVLEGSLNSRGWVLQERALARRTIYFSHNQTYFECGNGIRCETLAMMHNHMARFLGDPKFPNKAMRESSRALRISWFQDLYKQYSRLGFTRVDDKPFAIAGLEKRLQRAFGTEGGFGIFDDGNKPNGGLFHRSLLWRRSEEPGNVKSLRPIVFPVERNIRVPSWSWMAYEGGIEYIDPPFQMAEWETKEIIPPWTRSPKKISSVPHYDDIALTGIVRDFGVAGRGIDEVKLVYDSDRAPASDGRRPQCIVVARIKGDRAIQDILHYVILVAPIPATITWGEMAYKRIGVGYMLGRFISLDQTGLLAKIY